MDTTKRGFLGFIGAAIASASAKALPIPKTKLEQLEAFVVHHQLIYDDPTGAPVIGNDVEITDILAAAGNETFNRYITKMIDERKFDDKIKAWDSLAQYSLRCHPIHSLYQIKELLKIMCENKYFTQENVDKIIELKSFNTIIDKWDDIIHVLYTGTKLHG